MLEVRPAPPVPAGSEHRFVHNTLFPWLRDIHTYTSPSSLYCMSAACDAVSPHSTQDVVKRQDEIITKQESEVERQSTLIKELEARPCLPLPPRRHSA